MDVPRTYEHFAHRTNEAERHLHKCISLLRNTQYDAEDDGYPMTERKTKELADAIDQFIPQLIALAETFSEAAEAAFTTEDEW